MTSHTFSPDVLAANPDLAKRLATSKAQTPSGRGNGFTDDIQKYGPVVHTPEQCRAHVAAAASQFAHMLAIWGTDTELQRAAIATAELVEREARK